MTADAARTDGSPRRLVLLIGDSPWQRALAVRLGDLPMVELAGIVVQSPRTTATAGWVGRMLLRRPGRVLDKVFGRLLLGGVHREIAHAELRWFGRDGRPRPWPEVPRVEVEDVNGPATIEFLRDRCPDLVAVSGTSIVRDEVIEAGKPARFLNLHTGLSPYYRGGPNCTLWAFARGEPEFAGATIHDLDLGIDTGPLLITGHTPFGPDDGLGDAVCRTVAFGHDLYRRAVKSLATDPTVPGVPQDEVGEGHTFYTREWGWRELRRAHRFVTEGRLRDWAEAGAPGTDAIRTVDVFADRMRDGEAAR